MRLPLHVQCGGGVGFLISFLLVACANSPTAELTRAQGDLKRLEKEGAEAYLPQQLAGVREGIRQARECIQRNNFGPAGKILRSARALLDSCATSLAGLRHQAKAQSEAQLSRLQSGLDSLALTLQTMSKQSYLDQNRYDVHSLKLIRLRQEVAALRLDIDRRDYPLALQKGTVLERNVRKTLTAATEGPASPVVTVANSTVRTTL